jgi:hypothetical protein
MRHTNIVFLLQMTKDYLDGKIDVTSYRLDFPYELETRYKKMLRENRLMAELIYDCLVEDGVFLYDDLSDEDFEDQIRRQYEFVDDVYHGRTYM